MNDELGQQVEAELQHITKKVLELYAKVPRPTPKYLCFGNEPTPLHIQINSHMNQIRKILFDAGHWKPNQ